MIWLHVSELSIDRLLAGELPADDASAMRDHAASCPRCNALLDDALDVQRTFALPLEFPLRFQERAPRRRIAPWIAATTALAAGFLLVFAWPRASSPAVEERVRTKGAAVVGFYVAHDNQVRRGALREQVTPHDRIQLFTTTTTPMWLAIIGDDAAGVRSVYVAPRPLDPGREQLLPLSIELDATLGDEQLTAMFCPEPFDVTAPPSTCTLDRFTLAKASR